MFIFSPVPKLEVGTVKTVMVATWGLATRNLGVLLTPFYFVDAKAS